ncbi:holo-ACP synthase [Alkaliphilus hydrothermalis]|uniref:Holo-[acyl-carrier-protein] synthase n=1 Tax=Alkaliphilus hydrothermalis TaxID=1482730 RepID=A0ABS2NMU2_9FIRM|nr:holo-ACP synthase [Alkaliphilus hydrothermalis]MBM7614264.1 holo-[acyl-carrier protein] synthase [Alkaliphilus hydrothermalis]
MIKGIGIDMIEIERIKEAMEKNSKFIERFFTSDEIGIFEEKNFRPSTIAGFFAAKEAVVKSLGTGFRHMKWKDVEIYQDPLGKPYVKLHNNGAKIAYDIGIEDILISISHSRFNAVAQAIALGGE